MAPSAITTEKILTNNIYTTKNGKFAQKKYGGKRYEDYLTRASKDLVLDVMKTQATRINGDTCEAGEEDAFYVADLGEVYRQHLRWKLSLPRVKPFYGQYNHDSV